MKFTVHLVDDAEQDLFDIYQYVARNDTRTKADKLLENLESTILRLQTMPLRGHVPLELERVGVLEFREVLFKPYRIIYEVVKTQVYVHCVLDGRRNMQDLLQERILRRGA
jgi:toxin ParE1/3/4